MIIDLGIFHRSLPIYDFDAHCKLGDRQIYLRISKWNYWMHWQKILTETRLRSLKRNKIRMTAAISLGWNIWFSQFWFSFHTSLHFLANVSRSIWRVKCMTEHRVPLCSAKIRTSARNCWKPAEEDGELAIEVERVANTTKVVWWEKYWDYFSFANHFVQFFFFADILRADSLTTLWKYRKHQMRLSARQRDNRLLLQIKMMLHYLFNGKHLIYRSLHF